MCATFGSANLTRSCSEAPDAPSKQPSATERDLVRQLQAGGDAAFHEFIERYQTKIYRVVNGILGNREDSGEIAQQVFVKAYFSAKSLDARSSLYAWIYRIAVDECYRFLRKKRPKPFRVRGSADNASSMGAQMTPESRHTSDRVAVQRNLLNKLLEGIPAEDRLMLLLRELEGYSVAKLSEATGLNENTIKVRLLQTRQRLAKGLQCEAGAKG